VIKEFTQPGDWVYDPFMGGGTTLVEAIASGRHAVGTDISSLSVFISRVKTRLYNDNFFRDLGAWARKTAHRLDLRKRVARPDEWIDDGYQRNLSTRRTWHIRKLIELSLQEIERLPTNRHRDFARCAILKTAQWALDCREQVPDAEKFRKTLVANVAGMAGGSKEFLGAVDANREAINERIRVVCLQRSAVGADTDRRLATLPKPRLILTSPPYPGVHVLYHRWQIRGRRETPAPFWIANKLDGAGSAYYTFGDRHREELAGYFVELAKTFASLKKLADKNTLVVQLVAFSNLKRQLPRYLETMESAGWREVIPQNGGGTSSARLWRAIPNRRWYASRQERCESDREVVLFHQLEPNATAANTIIH
jgi:hypothetical protein